MDDQMQAMQPQDGVFGFVANDAPTMSGEDPFAEPPVTDFATGGEYIAPAMSAPVDSMYMPPAMESYQAPQANYEGMGGMDTMNYTMAAPDPMSFTAAAPDPMSFTAAAPAMPQTGYADPFQGMPVADSGMGAGARSIPEMNALREWEDKHERELEEIDTKEKNEKKDRRQAAQEELAKWNEEQNANTKKRHATNRTDESASEVARAEAMKPGANPWKLVAELIDTNARTSDESRDTSRMRSLLIQLKTSPVITQ